MVCEGSASRTNPKFKKCTKVDVAEESRLFNRVDAVYKFVPRPTPMPTPMLTPMPVPNDK